MAEPVDSVVVGVVTDGSTTGPEVELLDDPGSTGPPAAPAIKVGYERKFNLGDYNALTADILIWLRSNVPEGEAFDLHGAISRTKQMARDNVRAQSLRARGKVEPTFLGLMPPDKGRPDPVYVRTVSLGLSYRVNLGHYDSICPSYTDWADLRHVKP